jgi:hypothetical protein
MNVECVFLIRTFWFMRHDLTEGRKHEKAKRIVAECWKSGKHPKISIQVLQEVHVTLVGKGLETSVSADLVRNYLAWDIIENRESIFRDSLRFKSS